MVVFTCNNCGESLKKNAVSGHSFKCRKPISVGCMDCFKDFDKDSYSAHTQCLSELQRYSGKDFVPKANENKGQRKQEAWVDLVRSISEKKQNLSLGVKNILSTISSFDNIPRKKAKFLNFMQNSFRYMKHHELEEAWTLLEEAMKENRPQPTQNGAGSKNGTSQNGKHKLENEPDEKQNGTTTEEPAKKKKKNDESKPEEESPAEEPSSDKFSWTETIKSMISAKNNEIKLKKLKKKVLKSYYSITGSEVNDKIENKFNKKLNKLKGIVIDNEKVKLIEA